MSKARWVCGNAKVPDSTQNRERREATCIFMTVPTWKKQKMSESCSPRGELDHSILFQSDIGKEICFIKRKSRKLESCTYLRRLLGSSLAFSSCPSEFSFRCQAQKLLKDVVGKELALGR